VDSSALATGHFGGRKALEAMSSSYGLEVMERQVVPHVSSLGTSMYDPQLSEAALAGGKAVGSPLARDGTCRCLTPSRATMNCPPLGTRQRKRNEVVLIESLR